MVLSLLGRFTEVKKGLTGPDLQSYHRGDFGLSAELSKTR